MDELDRTYGVVFIGVLISAILFGVTNLQVFIYFQRYSRDSIWDKSLSAVYVYYYLITNYLNPLELLKVVWSFKAQIMIDAIVVIFVHTLYTIRLWKSASLCLNVISPSQSLLGERRSDGVARSIHISSSSSFRPHVKSMIVFLGYGVAALLCYEITQFELYTDLLQDRWVTYVPFGTATFIDTIIAGSLCFLLARCRTGFHEMDSTITVLMVYTLNTGVLTTAIFFYCSSVCSITAMATFSALPDTFTVLCIEFLVTKMYINSFMAMFNARNKLRSQAPVSEEGLTPLKHLSSGGSSNYTTTTLQFSSHGHPSALALGRDAYTLRYSEPPLSPLSPLSPQSQYFASVEKDEKGMYRLPSMSFAPLSPPRRTWRKPAPEMDAGAALGEDIYTQYKRAPRRVSRSTVSEMYEWTPGGSASQVDAPDAGSFARPGDSTDELYFGVGIALTKD
ncbi:hypothetical protein BKA93DRAFT_826674 [Sparassis latifolia]